jgi:hypothetical protein
VLFSAKKAESLLTLPPRCDTSFVRSGNIMGLSALISRYDLEDGVKTIHKSKTSAIFCILLMKAKNVNKKTQDPHY